MYGLFGFRQSPTVAYGLVCSFIATHIALLWYREGTEDSRDTRIRGKPLKVLFRLIETKVHHQLPIKDRRR